MGAPTRRRHDSRSADFQIFAIAQSRRFQRNFAQSLHQGEAGFLIHRQGMARHGAAFGGGDPDALGFAHQIAHGQHQALANQHAAAFAFRAKYPRGEGIRRHLAPQADHGAIGLIQVEAMLRWVGLQMLGDVPVFFRHDVSVQCIGFLYHRLSIWSGYRVWQRRQGRAG